MEFKLPDLGENIEEATVVEVLVSAGDQVEEEDPILEIETDKATLEVPSPAAGTIESIKVKEGDSLKIGEVIAVIEESSEDAGTEEDTSSKKDADEDSGNQADDKEEPDAEERQPSRKNGKEQETESGSEKEEEEKDGQGEEAEKIPPDRGAAQEDKSEDRDRAPEGETIPFQATKRLPVFAAPSVRQLAREIGVDLHQVSGSGAGGRISLEDVKRYARHNRKPPTQSPASSGFNNSPLPDFSQWGEVEAAPLKGIRKKTAQHMVRSWTPVPQVTLTSEADATLLEDSLNRLKNRVEHATGAKLTLTAILLKLTACALRAFPGMRVSIDMTNELLIRKQYCHIGVAVDTPGGLLVPVIRDPDTKSIAELSAELEAVAGKAREGKLSLADMQGGVFTLTNLGGLGTAHFTPVVNFPESGILGIGKITTAPAWDEERGQCLPRRRLPLSLAFDHRALDGADGARFLEWIKQAVEDPLLCLVDPANPEPSES